MVKVFLAWIGNADIHCSQKGNQQDPGPIARSVHHFRYQKVVVLWDRNERQEAYRQWLESFSDAEVEFFPYMLFSPTEYVEIYEGAREAIQKIRSEYRGKEVAFSYGISSGTPAMSAVWILLANGKYPGLLVESSREKGVQEITLPFRIVADYLPGISETDRLIRRFEQDLPKDKGEFSSVLHESEKMQRLIAKAKYIAQLNVPVLLSGESGTGKELFAKAIHACSPRHSQKCISVNCGAIPENLFEAEFFGTVGGAYTDAKDKPGYLESADGGTVFLDEIGEMPLSAQVKLLRALQEKKIRRLGAKQDTEVDFRIIAATNRDLLQEIQKGNFREDLFYRIAVIFLKLPPLREREQDVELLIDSLTKEINDDFARQLSGKWQKKKLSAEAKNFLISYSWPGNVRELENTLKRLLAWTADTTIRLADAKEAIVRSSSSEDIPLQPLGEGFCLTTLLAETEKRYIVEALRQSQGKKTAASRLLGYNSHQVLSGKMKKFDLE